jgi:hypothetical protein
VPEHAREDYAGVQDLAVDPAKTMTLRSFVGGVIKQQFGDAFVSAVGNGPGVEGYSH